MLGNFIFVSWQQQEVIWYSSAFSTMLHLALPKCTEPELAARQS
jgi:hypothetical protein